jgi:hypothetical protein
VVLWYFYWNPKVANLYAYGQTLIQTDIMTQLDSLLLHSGRVLKRFYQDAFYYTGFLFFVLGVFLSIKEKKSFFKTLLIASTSLLYVLFAGFKFAEHTYYIIPLVPFMALGAAYGLTYLNSSRVSVFILCLIVTESFSNQVSDVYFAKPKSEFLTLEEYVDNHLSSETLVATNSGMNTNMLYFSHRKGWALNNSDFGNAQYMRIIGEDDCEYVLWYKKNGTLDEIQPEFQVISENENFYILRLVN